MTEPVVYIPQPIGFVSDKYNEQPNSTGLDMNYLSQVDTLIIQQMKTGSNIDKRFVLKNDRGEQLFILVKSPKHIGCNAFEAILFNNANEEVFRIHRIITGCSMGCLCSGCCNGCCGSCVIQTEVQAPIGVTVGYLTQRSTLVSVNVDLLDDNHEEIIKVNTPWCVVHSEGYQNEESFEMTNMNDGSVAGTFTRKYITAPSAIRTYPSHYALSFNQATTVKNRQLMLGGFLSLYCSAFAYNIPQKK